MFYYGISSKVFKEDCWDKETDKFSHNIYIYLLFHKIPIKMKIEIYNETISRESRWKESKEYSNVCNIRDTYNS